MSLKVFFPLFFLHKISSILSCTLAFGVNHNHSGSYCQWRELCDNWSESYCTWSDYYCDSSELYSHGSDSNNNESESYHDWTDLYQIVSHLG